jgi:hypothetical protein
MANLSLALLHSPMTNKEGSIVTTSLTPIDIHDLARSATTFGLKRYYIAHPSVRMRSLAHEVLAHWVSGSGSTYNPDRQEALSRVYVVSDLEEIIWRHRNDFGKKLRLIATSARASDKSPNVTQLTFTQARAKLQDEPDLDYLLMLGTGFGMASHLLGHADFFLEPIYGPFEYNHLSVRSAGAILLYTLMGR